MAAALRAAVGEAVAHREGGRVDEAIKRYEAAIRLDGDCVEALVGLGLVYHNANKSEKAIHLFRSALRSHPTNVFAHYNLGAVLHSKGQVDEAIRHYKVVLRSDFADGEREVVAYTHCNMGLALEVKNRAGEAIRHYRYATCPWSCCSDVGQFRHPCERGREQERTRHESRLQGGVHIPGRGAPEGDTGRRCPKVQVCP